MSDFEVVKKCTFLIIHLFLCCVSSERTDIIKNGQLLNANIEGFSDLYYEKKNAQGEVADCKKITDVVVAPASNNKINCHKHFIALEKINNVSAKSFLIPTKQSNLLLTEQPTAKTDALTDESACRLIKR